MNENNPLPVPPFGQPPTTGRIRRDIDTEQLRELERRLSNLQTIVDNSNLGDAIVDENPVVPAMVNFADNTDFIYSDRDYNVNATTYLDYTDANHVLAHWYGRVQSTGTAWTENASATESANESIRSSAHTSGYRTGRKWNTNEGSLILTGGYEVASRMHTRNASAGNYLVARMQISRVLGTTPAPATDVKLKVSIWDNTDNGSGAAGIIRGAFPTLASSIIGGAGAVRRDYILEAQMPDGRRFYSDTATFTVGQNRVDTSTDPTTISSTQYVSVSWEEVFGASRYRIYRRTPALPDTNWYLVETITNGSTQTNDYGGTGGGTWAIPSFNPDTDQYQRATAYYDNVGEIIQVGDSIQEISVGIRVPFNYSPNGYQFLKIELVKADYSDTTTTQVPTDSIRIDHVGLSYTNGRWSPSSRDMDVAGGLVPDPPPSGGGGGGGNPHEGCVLDETPILMWDDGGNHYYMPAAEIVKGDRVVSWDIIHQVLSPSTVLEIYPTVSTHNSWIKNEEGKLLGCSFIHSIITNINDFVRGTKLRMKPKTCLCLASAPTEQSITIEEVKDEVWHVRNFRLTNGRHNYIANGFFCHNIKFER